MQVTVTASDGCEKSWTLPNALLSQHSAYFERLKNFKEGQERKVALKGFEPEIFELFVQFIYFGRFSPLESFKDFSQVPKTAEAWVLGDYLVAIDFQHFTLKRLLSFYFPSHGGKPGACLGPQMIEYCWSNTAHNSELRNLCLVFAAKHWQSKDIIVYDDTNHKEWIEVWDKYQSFRDWLFRLLQKPEKKRGEWNLRAEGLLLKATKKPNSYR